MKKTSKRNNNLAVSSIDLNSIKNESQNNFVELLPLEVTLKTFSQLDVRSLCRASVTCRSWNHAIRNNDSLWRPHCLTVRAVCQRQIDDDVESGYSWRVILLRNYQKSKVKILPEKIIHPMDADAWGEILEAELER
uniref:F-box only protein n=1 Tax=Jaculus jaculus TaxID=51337 RepID=A0A8C5KBW7_JACJA